MLSDDINDDGDAYQASQVARGAVLEGSDDFHHTFDRLSANSSHRHRVPGLLQYGLTRAAKIEEGLSDAEKIDVTDTLVSCLAHLAARYVHSSCSQTTPSNFMSRPNRN
jgi:hypothetical protein